MGVKKMIMKRLLKRFGLGYGTVMLGLTGLSMIIAKLTDTKWNFRDFFFDFLLVALAVLVAVDFGITLCRKYKKK